MSVAIIAFRLSRPRYAQLQNQDSFLRARARASYSVKLSSWGSWGEEIPTEIQLRKSVERFTFV